MENFRIESLEINKIGAFEHLKMDFPKKKDPEKAEIHILTGENGTGKTTVLHLLTHCVPFPENWLLEKFHSISNKKSNFKIDISSYDLAFEVKGVRNYFRNIDDLFDEDLESLPENFKSLPPDIVHYPNNGVHSFALFVYSGYRKTVNSELEGVRQIKNHPLENSLDFDKSINSDLFAQWVANTKSKYALHFLRTVENNQFSQEHEKYNTPIKIIENTISEITGQSTQLILDENTLQVKISFDKMQPISFNHLPDGLLSMISWFGDLLMRLDRITWEDKKKPLNEQTFILFLDEIEVHLHPAWQRKILPVVQELFKNAQIFISTHSPFVVGSIDGAWVHKFKKDGAYAVLDGEPILSNDGKTFVQILSETFDITSLFGEQNERKIARFKEIKNLILSSQPYDETEFTTLIDELTQESRALENLIGIEIRQINKTLGIDILAPHETIS